MKFKRDFSEILKSIEYRVNEQVKMAFIAPKGNYYGEEVKVSLNDVIAKAVAEGVVVGIATLIAEQYTNEDFENDIGLR